MDATTRLQAPSPLANWGTEVALLLMADSANTSATVKPTMISAMPPAAISWIFAPRATLRNCNAANTEDTMIASGGGAGEISQNIYEQYVAKLIISRRIE